MTIRSASLEDENVQAYLVDEIVYVSSIEENPNSETRSHSLWERAHVGEALDIDNLESTIVKHTRNNSYPQYFRNRDLKDFEQGRHPWPGLGQPEDRRHSWRRRRDEALLTTNKDQDGDNGWQQQQLRRPSLALRISGNGRRPSAWQRLSSINLRRPSAVDGFKAIAYDHTEEGRRPSMIEGECGPARKINCDHLVEDWVLRDAKGPQDTGAVLAGVSEEQGRQTGSSRRWRCRNSEGKKGGEKILAMNLSCRNEGLIRRYLHRSAPHI